jgi:hypothetical protein
MLRFDAMKKKAALPPPVPAKIESRIRSVAVLQ